MIPPKLVLALVMLLGLPLLGCSSKSDGQAPSESPSGVDVYQQPLKDGNTFACATCHALAEPSADGLRRPGHPIGNATRRSHCKNGKAASFLKAANTCVTEWMVAPSWRSTYAHFVALRDFQHAQAPAGSAPNIKFEIT